jgi:AcrR family transcriptional regulator
MRKARRTRDADASRQRLWEAAAAAFAERGYDGAKVDAIAAAAGVNKAMLYYHFADKQALYRAILTDMFTAVGEATAAVRAEGGAPDRQLREYVAAMVRAAEARPHFPAIWLREVADAGRHLDPAVFTAMRGVLTHLRAILQAGARQQQWRVVDPFLVQAGIAAPIMLVLATRGIRARAGIATAGTNKPDVLVEHFTASTLAMLTTSRRSPR